MSTGSSRHHRLVAVTVATGALAAVAVAVAVLPAAAGAATGTPIVYRESAVASGTLDGVSFTNVTVTIEQDSTTAGVTNQGTGFPQNRTGTVTVTVAGIGSDTLTRTISYVNQAYQGSADFGFNGGGGFDFSVSDPSFASYNLDRAFGPVTGPSHVAPTRGAVTAKGSLKLTSAGPATFTATAG